MPTREKRLALFFAPNTKDYLIPRGNFQPSVHKTLIINQEFVCNIPSDTVPGGL